MKFPNRRELQWIVLNHSSDVDFKDFIKAYKKCAAEAYFSLVNDTTLPLDNPLRIRKNLLKTSINIIMTIKDQIRDKKTTVWY